MFYLDVSRLSAGSEFMMFIISFLGPGNVHFDYGQDVYFIKLTREHLTQGGMAKDAERRLVMVGLLQLSLKVRS